MRCSVTIRSTSRPFTFFSGKQMIKRVVRMQRVKGPNAIEVAARHNLREIAAERGGKIDPTRVGQNTILCGSVTAAGVTKDANLMLDLAGIGKLRKDAVRALEIVVSLPEATAVDLQDKVFNATVGWVRSYFGAPLLSAVV